MPQINPNQLMVLDYGKKTANTSSKGVNATTILSKLKKLTGNSSAKLIHQVIENVGGFPVFTLDPANRIEVSAIRLFSDGNVDYTINPTVIVILVDELPKWPFALAQNSDGSTKYTMVDTVYDRPSAKNTFIDLMVMYDGDADLIVNVASNTSDSVMIGSKYYSGDLNRTDAVMAVAVGQVKLCFIRKDCIADTVYVEAKSDI